MKLSIIIVSYNESRFLEKAVGSCLDQDYDDYEIIIGDDGSDDGSVDIIKRYAETNNIKYFVMERNAKYYIPSIRVSDIIKRALEIADGQYVCVLSGDDFFVDMGRFREHTEFLDTHSAYSAVYSKYEEYHEKSRRSNAAGSYCNWRSLFWSGMYAHISCFTFRKKIYEDNQLLDKMCDDTGLTYSIAIAGKWHTLPSVTMAYRQRDGSIMHKADKLELSIIELMLLQDVLNKKKMISGSLSRYYKPLSYCMKRRTHLKEEKYHKYIEACNGYDNNILKEIIDSEKKIKPKLKINGLQIISLLCYLFYGFFRKAYKLIDRR